MKSSELSIRSRKSSNEVEYNFKCEVEYNFKCKVEKDEYEVK